MDAQTAHSALRTAVGMSFNRISVDGHTSTNDAVLLLCPTPPPGRALGLGTDQNTCQLIQENLNSLCIELAKRIPTDGEGASHLIHITVTGASSAGDADRIARCIALSNLVKTAIFGGDPNWGRIVSAAGYAGVPFSVDQTDLRINGHVLFCRGQPVPFDNLIVSQSIRNSPQTEIELVVGEGPGQIDHWTSDLTADYVKLNAQYTT
jgi:glutamate N-acetyltransferase/amino-acid N-acetyltransferase